MSLHDLLNAVTSSINPELWAVLVQSKVDEESSCLSHSAFLGKLGTWAQKLSHFDVSLASQIFELCCHMSTIQSKDTARTSHGCPRPATHLRLLGTQRPGRLQVYQVELESSQFSQLTCMDPSSPVFAKKITHDQWLDFVNYLSLHVSPQIFGLRKRTKSWRHPVRICRTHENSGVKLWNSWPRGFSSFMAQSQYCASLPATSRKEKPLCLPHLGTHGPQKLRWYVLVSKLKGSTWQEWFSGNKNEARENVIPTCIAMAPLPRHGRYPSQFDVECKCGNVFKLYKS